MPITKYLVLAMLWFLALNTWGSIAHAFFGFPDTGLLLGSSVAVAIMVAPFVLQRRNRA